MNKIFQYKVFKPVQKTAINRVWVGDFEGDYVDASVNNWLNYWSAQGSPTSVDRYRKDAFNGTAYYNCAVFNGYSSYAWLNHPSGTGLTWQMPYAAAMISAQATDWQDAAPHDILGSWFQNGSNCYGVGITMNYTPGYLSAVIGLGGTSFIEAKVLLSTLAVGEHKFGIKADGSNLKLFVDGTAVTTTAYTGSISWNGTGNLGIILGAGYKTSSATTPSSNYFSGEIDQAVFYASVSAGTGLPADTNFATYAATAAVQITNSLGSNGIYLFDFRDLITGSTGTIDALAGQIMTLNNVTTATGLNSNRTCIRIVTAPAGSANQGIGLTTSKPAVTAMASYMASAYVKGVAGKTARLQIVPVGGGSTASQDIILNGSWQRVALPYTAAVGATNLEIDVLLVGANVASTTFYVDGVMLEDGTTLDDFFTQDTTPTNMAYYYGSSSSLTHTATIKSFSYVTSWINEVTNDYQVAQAVNDAGGTAITVNLARPADNFGERSDIDFNNRVQIEVISDDYPNGQVMFIGKIMDYTPHFGEAESVDVELLGYGDEMGQMMIEAGPVAAFENLLSGNNIESAGFANSFYFGQAYTAPSTQRNMSGVSLYARGGIISTWNGVGDIHDPANFITSYFGGPVDMTVWDSYAAATGGIAASPIARAVGTIVADGVFRWVDFNFYDTAGNSTNIRVNPNQQYFFKFYPRSYNGASGASIIVPISDTNASNANDYIFDLNGITDHGNALQKLANNTLKMRVNQGYGATKVAYNSMDPGAILRKVIDDYNRQGGTLTYDASSIELTGTTVSYTFNTNTVYEGMQQCLTLAPAGWYAYVDQATNKVHFHSKETTTTYTLTMGKDFVKLDPRKRAENIVNVVYFSGGPDPDNPAQNLFRVYRNQASIDLYGVHALKYSDRNVTIKQTADIIASALLQEHAAPEVQADLIILPGSINIDAVNPGDRFALAGLSQTPTSSLWDQGIWDNMFWDFDIASLETLTLQIAKIDYTPNGISTTLSSTPTDVNKRVEDISRNLEVQQNALNPSVAVSTN